MKTIILFFTLGFLASCSNQQVVEPYEDPAEAFDLTEGNKPVWSSNGSKSSQINQTQPQVIYAPTAGTLKPLVRKEGVLSFDEWKKAKETNSKEYQEYLEYREYLQTLQSQ